MHQLEAERSYWRIYTSGIWCHLKQLFGIKAAVRTRTDDFDANGLPVGARKGTVDLGDIARDLISNIRLILLYACISTVLGLFYLAASTPKYDISVQLISIPQWLRSQPVNQVSSGLSSLLGTNQDDLFRFFGDALHSKQIYIDLDKSLHVRQHIFPGQWDERSKRWQKPSGLGGLRRTIANGLKTLVGFPPVEEPTVDDLRDQVLKQITVYQGRDGIIRIEMKSANVQYDLKILQFVLNEADKAVRSQMVAYVGATINGLQDQLKTTNETVLRQALIDKLAAAMTKRAELQNNKILAIDLSGVEVSDRPIFPSFFGTLVAAFMIGLLFPIALIFVRGFFV